MEDDGRRGGAVWFNRRTVVAGSLTLPVLAFIMLWQVQARFHELFAHSLKGMVAVQDDLSSQALRFVAIGAALALLGAVCALNAQRLNAGARVLIAGSSAVLLAHAAFLGTDVWLYRDSAPYLWLMLGAGVLYALALVTELFRAIYEGLSRHAEEPIHSR